MIQASYHHREKVIRILADSFSANQSVTYVIRQDARQRQRLAGLIAYSFDLCLTFGQGWLSDDGSGCALVLFPDRKRTTWQTLWWEATLVSTVFGVANVPRVLRRENAIRGAHPPTPFAHLWYVGVDPDRQGQGIGSRLLTELIEEYEQQHRPVYLETSTARNVPWYERHGFEVYRRLFFSYELLMLRRC